MKKQLAIRVLGGGVSSAAQEIGISPAAVSQWPDVLPRRLEDRVLAACVRKYLPPDWVERVSAAQITEAPKKVSHA